MRTPEDYHNGLIGLNDARQLFEAGCRWYLHTGNHEAALQVARLYERLAVPGTAQELAGQAAEAWGKMLLEQVRSPSTR